MFRKGVAPLPSRISRGVFLSAVLISLLLGITACNRKDNGVSPVNMQSSTAIELSTAPPWEAGLPSNSPFPKTAIWRSIPLSNIRLNIRASEFGATGVLPGSLYGWPTFSGSIESLSDNEPTGVSITNPYDYPVGAGIGLILTGTQLVSRVYAVVSGPSYPLWVGLWGGPGFYFQVDHGPIDVTFQPPIPASQVGLQFGGIAARGQFFVSELQVYGPTPAASFKIKNLSASEEVDPFADYVKVSYRAAKTRFQAVEVDPSGIEIGPATVDWEIQGGAVVATEQLRMGILNHLGQVNTRIGNIGADPVPDPGSIFPILNKSLVTFHSFLPGDITLIATKGTASDSVAIRIKKPVFKVNVYPVGDVETSIFETWESITHKVWEKEGIIKVESVSLQSAIPNVTYPNSPLTPPMQGAEEVLQTEFFIDPSLGKPLVYDCLLGDTSGFYNVPRESGILLATREPTTVNVYLVNRPLSYYVSDSFTTPPEKALYFPDIYPFSSREYFVTLETFGIAIRTPFSPFLPQHERYLAAGIGRCLGLFHAAEWLGNLMDFSPIGGQVLTPEQFIAALNYRNDNPQNSTLIWEE